MEGRAVECSPKSTPWLLEPFARGISSNTFYCIIYRKSLAALDSFSVLVGTAVGSLSQQ
jgi:hypothetical protein